MDTIRIVMNPEERYMDDIISEIIRTDDWNRIEDEISVWKKGFQVFEFYVAIDEKKDQAVASIGITMDKSPSGDPREDLFCLGDFYVREGYRGIGLGMKLFNMIMERTRNSNVNLNAVMSVVDFYDKRFGFKYYPEYFNVHCKLDTDRITVKEYINSKEYKIVDLSDANWKDVCCYDQSICSRERSNYLKAWTGCVDAVTKVATSKNGQVVGMACIRKQKKNRLTVGPFYAENESVAEILLNQLLSSKDIQNYDQVWFRFPEPNEAAIRILRSIYEGEFYTKRSTKSQFNKKLIEPNPLRIFSVFESGHSIV